MLGIKHALNTGTYSKLSQLTVGLVVASIEMDNSILIVRFAGGAGLQFSDNGQSCCESRYMTTDDKLEDYIGAQFVGAELKHGPSLPGGDAHDTAFLEIMTTKGALTIVNHNEHNGYYGGFNVEVDLL